MTCHCAVNHQCRKPRLPGSRRPLASGLPPRGWRERRAAATERGSQGSARRRRGGSVRSPRAPSGSSDAIAWSAGMNPRTTIAARACAGTSSARARGSGPALAGRSADNTSGIAVLHVFRCPARPTPHPQVERRQEASIRVLAPARAAAGESRGSSGACGASGASCDSATGGRSAPRSTGSAPLRARDASCRNDGRTAWPTTRSRTPRRSRRTSRPECPVQESGACAARSRRSLRPGYGSCSAGSARP